MMSSTDFINNLISKEEKDSFIKTVNNNSSERLKEELKQLQSNDDLLYPNVISI